MRRNLKWRTPETLSLSLRPAQSRLHTLYDQTALKLGDCGDYRKDGLAERRARVDLLAERDELDAEMAEEIERLYKMADRPSEAVEGYDHDDIDTAGFRLDHETVERWAAILPLQVEPAQLASAIRRKLSVRDAARELGVSPSSYARLVRGLGNGNGPTPADVARAAAAPAEL